VSLSLEPDSKTRTVIVESYCIALNLAAYIVTTLFVSVMLPHHSSLHVTEVQESVL